MRVGIIGGGLMGAALAYFLTEAGEQVTLLEQGRELGGLNGELRFDDGLRVARYQHSILPTDQAVFALCDELNLRDELVFQDAHSGFVHDRQISPLTNIRDFLTFPMLGFGDRLRLGRMILRARQTIDWRELDRIPAKEWLVQMGGPEAYERIWRPLLEAKFDGVYDNVAATYIWAWLNRMSAIRKAPQLRYSVGYLRRGHYSLIEALGDSFVRRGGQIMYEARVREIEVGGGRLQRVRTNSGLLEFDTVIVALATPVFARLIPGADREYLNRLEKRKYLGLICPVMVLKRPLSRYWTLNLTDPSYPFSTIIETPHPESPDDQVVYLPRYTAPDNDWMGVSDEDIREAWFSHLKQIFPRFREVDVRSFGVSRSRFVEPVHTVNTLNNPVEAQTPYAGLYLANTAQAYPELPSSETVIVHARRVAELVKYSADTRVPVTR